MKQLFISILLFCSLNTFAQSPQQRVDASDIIVREGIYLVKLDSTNNIFRNVVWDTVTKKLHFSSGTGTELDPFFFNHLSSTITAADTARWAQSGLWSLGQGTYRDDQVTIGSDTVVTGFHLFVDGDAKINGSITLDAPFPSIQFKNQNGGFIDAELILLNDSTMLLNNVQYFGWMTQPVTPTPQMKMVVIDTVNQVTYHTNIPEAEINYGFYRDDKDAELNGVPIGGEYTAPTNNKMGMRPGETKKRFY